MLKKLLIFSFFSLIFVSSAQALSLEPINNLPPKKSSETIEEYKTRLRKLKEQYIDEYKQQAREEKQNLQQYQEQTQQKTQQKTQTEVKDQICLNLEDKIDQRVANFEDVQQTHEEKYQKLSSRLSNALSLLKEQGYDTGKLAADLDELDGLISAYSQAYSDFVDSLIFTRGFACGDKESDFRDALRNSKELLAVVKQKRAEIREFYTGVIRADIRDLRKQADEKAADESEQVGTDTMNKEGK